MLFTNEPLEEYLRMRKKSLQLIIFSVVILLCLFSFFFLFIQGTIHKIIVISSLPHMYGLEIINGKNMIFLDTTQLAQYILKRNPRIKSIKIEKIFPHTLSIHLSTREPIASIKESVHTFAIDSEGILLPLEEQGDTLPVIQVENTIFWVTEKTDWRLIKAVSILDKMRKESIFIYQIVIKKDTSHFHVYVDPSIEVIIPFESDPQMVATSLQIIITRFRIEGKFISKVDFQFDKPIVTLRNGENISSH